MSMLMNTEQNQADQIMTQEDEPQNREIYMKALEYFMPACIMVSAKNEVRHLFGDCTNFIHMAPGKFTSDVFSLLTADLRIAVSTALKTAREHRRKMTYTGIPVKGEKNAQTITLTAMPIPDGFDEPSGLMAIILMDEKQSKPTDNAVAYDIDRVAAQQANAEKNTFLSRMSHDMRTPLNAIMGYTYMTQERGDVPADVRDSLQKIQDSGEYLLGIITDVLDTSMLESGKMKSEPEPVMEEEIIHDVEDMILLQAENQRIFFIHSINGCKNECLLVDKAHVTQILVNLLSNAVKFTSENGKVEFITDVEQVDKKHIQHRYTISDNGRGMSQAFQHKMYLPFEQEMMKCDHVGGTGLGLYIVKKLIDMLGGTISCDSQPGKGTTFKVTLTYTVASPEQKQRLGQADHRDFAGLRGKKILLCDDHELNMEIAKFMLENKEMSVVCASNGQEAVEKFIQSEPGVFDAILMDIRMPVMDGLQATMKIRSDPHKDAQRIPIIALTANALEEEEQICLQAGMNARLTKPIDPPQLYQTLADYTIGKKE